MNSRGSETYDDTPSAGNSIVLSNSSVVPLTFAFEDIVRIDTFIEKDYFLLRFKYC